MTMWLTIGLLVGLIGPGIIAGSVDVDFPENVNSRSAAASRIVSGWEAAEGQIPWQFSIRMVNPAGQVSACGGSIIHNDWGLTAAHCTAGRISFVIRAGVVNLTRPEYLFEATEFYNHPLYNNALPGVVQLHDIGVLKLREPVTYSPNLKPIRLQRSADMDTNYHAQRLVASGWGLTWTQGTSPENLNWVYLVGTSNEDCRSSYGGSPIIGDTTICAVHYNVTSQSTCQGDSGGPLTILEKDGESTLVGVASFVSGQGCHTVSPAGFIRPGPYHNWFYEVTGINFDWDWEDSEEAPELSSEESVSKPSSEESKPQPSSEESVSKPSSEESESQPSSEESKPQPSSEESAQQPSSEESKPRPSSEESAQQPSSEESKPRPSSEESAQQPSSEESKPRPSSEESAQQPSSEESKPRPSSEESKPQPSSEVSEENSNGNSDSGNSRPEADSFGRM